MFDLDYHKLHVFTHSQGFLRPENEPALNLVESAKNGENLTFKLIQSRDVPFHRAYFGLIGFIYDWLTPQFKNQVPKKHFYNWLKLLFGNYDIIYEFSNGQKLIEFKSISFGRMSQKDFEIYVKNQLPLIYDNVIHELYDYDKANMIIDNIEETYKSFLTKF